MKKIAILIMFGLLLTSCTQNNINNENSGIEIPETGTKSDAGYCSEYPEDYEGQCAVDPDPYIGETEKNLDEISTEKEEILENNSGSTKETNLDNNKPEIMKTTYQTELPKDGDIIAVMKTTNGTIKIKLFVEDVPSVVNNFIGLANESYYNGIIFHRVINNFMIQGGDPDGTGMGGRSIYGEKFDDEFSDKLTNMVGSISMANAGPNTNGSQFFINQADNSNLDFNKPPLTSKHAVFGQVYEGIENVNKIAKTKVGANDRPEKDVKIISLDIFKLEGTKEVAYKINTEEVIKEYNQKIEASKEAKKTKSIQAGDKISVNYTGTLEDGTVFDSSLNPGREPLEFEVGAGQMIKGFDAGVVGMKTGEKKTLTLKPEDAYGVYDEANTQEMQKEALQSFVDAGVALEAGAILPTPQGEFKIKEVKGDIVVIDINHQFAGKTLTFEVEIMEIK